MEKEKIFEDEEDTVKHTFRVLFLGINEKRMTYEFRALNHTVHNGLVGEVNRDMYSSSLVDNCR